MNAPSHPLAAHRLPAIRPEVEADAPAIDALIARAFGPGRFVKAAERLREGNVLDRDLSMVAWNGQRLAGAVRLWPARIGDCPVIFLGPIAVDPDWRRHGLGQALVEQACEAARQAGWDAVLLVGDAPWFTRMGFSAPAAAGVRMPGPVDQRRVMLRALRDGGADGMEGLARV